MFYFLTRGTSRDQAVPEGWQALGGSSEVLDLCSNLTTMYNKDQSIYASPTLPVKKLPERGVVRWLILEFYTLWNISGTANAGDVQFCIPVFHVKS